jgi:hypothetical protein
VKSTSNFLDFLLLRKLNCVDNRGIANNCSNLSVWILEILLFCFTTLTMFWNNSCLWSFQVHARTVKVLGITICIGVWIGCGHFLSLLFSCIDDQRPNPHMFRANLLRKITNLPSAGYVHLRLWYNMQVIIVCIAFNAEFKLF